MPRASSSAPREAAATSLLREDTTPPVTNTNLVMESPLRLSRPSTPPCAARPHRSATRHPTPERDYTLPDGPCFHNHSARASGIRALQHQTPSGFAGVRGERIAHPAIADGRELAADVDERQARALPRRNSRFLQQLLDAAPMPAQAAVFAAAAQAHLERAARRARARDARAVGGLGAQAPDARNFQHAGRIPGRAPVRG